MVFITLYFKKLLSSWHNKVLLGAAIFLLGAGTSTFAQNSIKNFKAEWSKEGVTVSALTAFSLSSTITKALDTGVPVTFLLQVNVYRYRWYWSDKWEGGQQRYYKVQYQPLIRRWKLTTTVNEMSSTTTPGDNPVPVNQYFESMQSALQPIKNINNWMVLSSQTLVKDGNKSYRVLLDLSLDIDTLPRPLRVGLSDYSDWKIHLSNEVNLTNKPTQNNSTQK